MVEQFGTQLEQSVARLKGGGGGGWMDSIRVRCSNNCDPGAHKSNQAPEEGHPTTRPYESNGICPILGHLLARMLENFQNARFH